MKPKLPLARLQIRLRGMVQGVGFRPYVFRLAGEHGLGGWVRNGCRGVTVEIEGPRSEVTGFLNRLPVEAPRHSAIRELQVEWLEPLGCEYFEIRPSEDALAEPAGTHVSPDLATCRECLREIFEPSNRRFRYPFTNCTQCGPRFSIIEALPYDRARTSMHDFAMCPACRVEFDDPRDRRFHAQPIACPSCGPQVTCLDSFGKKVAERDAVLRKLVEVLREGKIVAVKGIGGFQLLASGFDEAAVERLRRLKGREAKPLALMFPNMESVSRYCEISTVEAQLLESAEAPIVLLRRLKSQVTSSRRRLADSVAPGNPNLGVMLPYSPLHHLLLADHGYPLVVTSGNLGGDPIYTNDSEALSRLGGLVDFFLVHDRRIVRPVDDSVIRVIAGREVVLRRARGYAPAAIRFDALQPSNGKSHLFRRIGVLGMGAHQKSAVAVTDGKDLILGPHIADLDTLAAQERFRNSGATLADLFGIEVSSVIADGHPGYYSTEFARKSDLPVKFIQHHYAHVLSCMVENRESPPGLGVAWDGSGDGLDGTIWGGEFLQITAHGFERLVSLRPFRLPGGEAAVREPRRAALGMLHAALGASAFDRTELPAVCAFSSRELAILRTALEKGIHSPWTSSVGRLFDGVAALLEIRQKNRFEGEAAMELEFIAEENGPDASAYDFPLVDPMSEVGQRPRKWLDWIPFLGALLEDIKRGESRSRIAGRFHNGLANAILRVAELAGEEWVALSGGCFQNRLLTESVIARLGKAGFRPLWHRRVPPNDGGVALGQVTAALIQPDE